MKPFISFLSRNYLYMQVKEQEEQLEKLHKAKQSQQQDIEELKATVIALMGNQPS